MQYHLYGELYLEDPITYLSPTELAQLRTLEPHFRSLEQRNVLRQHVLFDFRSRFEEFRNNEPSLWDPPRPVQHLVRPSGDLRSPIAHHLHNPSFNTNDVTGIETADETNACIWLVMHNGFTQGTTLIFDHLARRENSEEVDGIRDYPPAILGCHEDFVEEIRANMQAVVEVVWGAPVRERMKKVYREKGNPLTEFWLWGSFKDVCLHLEWSSPGPISSQSRTLIRFIIFVIHPQVFLYPWGRKHARQQDLFLTAAGKLAKVATEPMFFQSRQLNTRNDFVKLVCGSENQQLGQAASSAVQAAKQRQKFRRSRSEEHKVRTVLSTSKLRVILKNRDKLLKSSMSDVDETGDYSYLPKELQEWLRHQQFTLFEGCVVSTASELKPFYNQYCRRGLEHTLSPIQLIQELLEIQSKHIAQQPQKQSLLDDLTFYGFGDFQIMPVKCSDCGYILPDDQAARWSIRDIRTYVKRRTPKHSCTKIGRNYSTPVDSSIATCFPDKKQLASDRRPVRTDWQRCLRRQEDCITLPNTVESWCIECKERSLLAGGGNKYVDVNPRWTVGEVAKYVERRPNCLKCGVSPRFIPIDFRIPSISPPVLRDFAEEFEQLSDSSIEVALNRRRPSRRKKRLLARKRITAT